MPRLSIGCEAIRDLKVRGAPAIGVTAAMGVALGVETIQTADYDAFVKAASAICDHLAATRPTAVNLFWAIERMKRRLGQLRGRSPADIKHELRKESQTILDEDIELCKTMGRHGAKLIREGQTILTHCNAGALATAGYGTALGVVRAAWEEGKKIKVIADETRPVLQGARLTAWELMQDKIPVTLITDNMAGSLMQKGLIHVCVVGADRIAANGDVANKIGTYSVAVLAKAHGIPFYVAAPYSTIDLNTKSGDDIPIEQRNPTEVTRVHGGDPIAPSGVDVLNPAFDVTPAALITGIITERGVFTPAELARNSDPRYQVRESHLILPPNRPTRALKYLGLVGSIVLLGAAIWAFYIEPASFHVSEQSLSIPRWPAEVKPLAIVVLADLHTGSPFNGLSKLREIVSETNRAAPDLILIAGDVVVQGVLGGSLVAPEDSARVLRSALSALTGSCMRCLWETTIMTWWLDAFSLRTIPMCFRGRIPSRVNLTIAGHTHGGQVFLPLCRAADCAV